MSTTNSFTKLMYSVKRCDPYRQIHTLYHKFNEPQKRILGRIGAHSTLARLRAVVRVAAIDAFVPRKSTKNQLSRSQFNTNHACL